MTLSEKARIYATARHAATTHSYDGKPYDYHLGMVAAAAREYIGEYEPEVQEVILAACWCHDLIEDARETYNDVKAEMGIEVAEIVYALTNEKGRTRAERANDKYYQGIRETPHATLIKLCDRIANVRQSHLNQSKMLTVYRKEYPGFKQKLYVPGEYESVWSTLEDLFR
jgi:(p)ppGpp synthase/HD superfamily hydrolase